jgi:hypothetical protein
VNSQIWKPILAQCAALHAQSNNENMTALAFQTDELSIIEYGIFRFFHTPSTFGTRNGNEDGGFFLSALVCLINRWMENIKRQTGRSSVKNSGRDSQTSHTHTDTHTQSRPYQDTDSFMNESV